MPCIDTRGTITIGIGGSTVTGPISIGIASAVQVPMSIGIQEQSAGIPILPLAAHTGGGAVLFTWLPPLSGTPFEYEIQCATSLNGPYFQYGRSLFRNPIGLINNFPLTRTMYFRIRSLTEDGNFSDWVQVKLGVLQKQSTVMQVKGMAGSVVSDGARVAILDGVDRLAGFAASGNIQL